MHVSLVHVSLVHVNPEEAHHQTVRTEWLFEAHPRTARGTTQGRFAPKVAAGGLASLAMMQTVLDTREPRWLRHAQTHLTPRFPYLPGQPGYNQRLHKLADDDVWIVDSIRSSGADLARP